jgi:GT2 family glycosyltransferase
MIYIVTPVFNRKTFTKNYLKALGKQTVGNFKIIIVDDGSSDGTSDMIENEFPDVILLKEDGDLWWAEATNIGVRYAIGQKANYIMTLNDDTLPAFDYIEKMLYWSKKKPDTLIGALALDHDTDEIIYGGENRSWKTGRSSYVLDGLSENEKFGLHEVSLFPGRGLLIPVNTFKKIGLYDSKNFPQTMADNDFTHRAINNGFKIFCNYDAKIKIYPDESAAVTLQNNKSLKNYIDHLFGMKGGGNLKWFIKCSLKNCPKRYLLSFIVKGVASRIIGYWINGLRKKS